MIVLKSRDEIARMRTASAVVAEVLATLREHAKAGVSTGELDEIAEDLTRKRGAKPAFKGYVKRHAEASGGREPDRWANPVTYASLQILQQAIERVGKIDRAAVIKEIQTGSFDTIVGKVKLQNNLRVDGWQVGQWQGGEYYGLAPANLPGARPVMFPKPAWK